MLAYLAAFVLAAYAFEAREGKNVLTRGLIVLGSLEAAYGMVQYLTGYQKIFGFTKQFYTNEATGTYINHNHFAGFLELVIPFAAMMVFYNLQSRSAHGVPERPRLRGGRYSLSLHPRILFYVFIVILLLIAVVFSRSRMGIFSVLASLILMAFLGRVGGGRRAWMVITLLVIACSMTYAIWIGIGPVISRFETLTPSALEDPYRTRCNMETGKWHHQGLSCRGHRLGNICSRFSTLSDYLTRSSLSTMRIMTIWK